MEKGFFAQAKIPYNGAFRAPYIFFFCICICFWFFFCAVWCRTVPYGTVWLLSGWAPSRSAIIHSLLISRPGFFHIGKERTESDFLHRLQCFWDFSRFQIVPTCEKYIHGGFGGQLLDKSDVSEDSLFMIEPI